MTAAELAAALLVADSALLPQAAPLEECGELFYGELMGAMTCRRPVDHDGECSPDPWGSL